jgi:D-alanyl-D-alanine carboxypeptidase
MMANTFVPLANGQIAAFARDAAARLQRLLDHFIGTLGNIGALAAIDVRGRGRCYFTSGHVDIERSRLAAVENHFQIASQSKTVVAMAMLLLHRDGVIDLDDSVRKYLDLPIDQRITIRHLIMNQCGLGEITMAVPAARWNPAVRLEPRDLVALALPQGQLFEPGSEFDYCNTGWTIAAMLMEEVCAIPYGEIIRARILQPLELVDTWFGGRFPTNNMLKGYVESEGTGGRIESTGANSWAFGAGDGVSRLDDMLTLFGSLILEKSPLGISLAELTAVTGKPSNKPYFPMSVGTIYGLGLERREWAGREVWGHPGSTHAYLSGTWVDAVVGVTVTTCITRATTFPPAPGSEYRYPREQLFAMALKHRLCARIWMIECPITIRPCRSRSRTRMARYPCTPSISLFRHCSTRSPARS